METKREARLRRAKQTRKRIALARATRLCVYRTNSHIYAAIHSADGGEVLASASTVDKEVRAAMAGKTGGNKAAAAAVGAEIAKRALAKGISAVAFDRSGFAYHGRVKELADAAREAGLKF
ncbi:50S ribosomal protein L18 [Limnobacter humi]|uniref:Large ribosomal subunit protein uL18 n=1 Tax=Limnobacter humi TaxID=1778671 RepID=A0ABT1WCW3_9BURK|nr:50S ribosomal protein L18 [Limnobacter humi]MCQ8895340.1 50S ribosomal protein L18 [Limnobacter humi]